MHGQSTPTRQPSHSYQVNATALNYNSMKSPKADTADTTFYHKVTVTQLLFSLEGQYALGGAVLVGVELSKRTARERQRVRHCRHRRRYRTQDPYHLARYDSVEFPLVSLREVSVVHELEGYKVLQATGNHLRIEHDACTMMRWITG